MTPCSNRMYVIIKIHSDHLRQKQNTEILLILLSYLVIPLFPRRISGRVDVFANLKV